MDMAFYFKTAFLFYSVLLTGFLAEGVQYFHQLKNNTITVQCDAKDGIKAGEGQLNVQWGWITGSNDTGYKTVQMKLCFGAISQTDRAWRATNDLLTKDKTCLFTIGSQPYAREGNNLTWTVTKNVPFAHYFVRAYVLDESGAKVAYNQTTDKNRTTNLFTVEPISGRHASIDIAAGVFSAFSVLSLFGFFFLEKGKAQKSS